jgi:hypothetical protein
MTENNQFWLWWQNHKSAFFLSTSFVLAVVLSFVPACQRLYLVSWYTFFLTGLIVFVKKRYREFVRVTEAPALVLPAKLKKTDKGKSREHDDNDSAFNLPQILIEEFEYAKETADQAMDDRHTLVNYFLLSAGVVLACFGIMVSEEGGAKFAYRYEVLVGLSLLFNIVGWVYFLQVVRLRQAWCESARAMNHIKQVFVKNCQFDFAIAKKCFRWDFDSLPKAAKKMTVFYFSGLLISILNSAAVVLASIILIDLNLFRKSEPLPAGHFIISIGMGLFHLFFQMSMYTALLEEIYETKNGGQQ